MTRAEWGWVKRRVAVEPIIGHLKGDHRMARNYLKGVAGDRMNALLAGCGFNIRKLLRELFAWLRTLSDGVQGRWWSQWEANLACSIGADLFAGLGTQCRASA